MGVTWRFWAGARRAPEGAGESGDGRGQLPSVRNPVPHTPHVEVGRGDLVQDRAVEAEGGGDTRAGDRVEHRDARLGLPVEPLVDPDQVGDRTAHARVRGPRTRAVLQESAVDTVVGEHVGGQVDPAPAQVLRHVAQEVGELEGLSQRRGVRGGRLPGHGRAEDRKDLESDDRGRAVHVLT